MIAAERRRMHRLLNEGVSKAGVARILGRSRQTIYNWLAEKAEPGSKGGRSSKLDPFRKYLEARLERFDIPATTLLRELREIGYRGGISILREAVARIKGEHVRRLVDRFETEPGLQAQIDWGSCGTIFHRGRRRRLSLFVLVLGHSRFIWARFVVSEKRPVLLELLEAAFRAIGGVPRELLVDNMKQIVKIARSADRPAVIQPAFSDFAAHWGFEVLACPAYWPRAKGKVERAVGYIKRSFLEGRSFSNLEELNAQLQTWLAEVANCRIHGTTQERPIDRLRADRERMLPIDGVTPYPHVSGSTRQVGIDSRISVDGVRYSVDPRIATRRRVEVTIRRSTDEVLRIYHRGQLVGHHRIRMRGAPPQDDPFHAALRRQLRARPPKLALAGKTPRFDQPRSPMPAWLEDAPAVYQRPLESYEEVLVS